MTRSYSIRDILNKFKWHPDFELAKVRVVYIDRPKGLSEITGEDIEEIGHMFLYLKSGAAIPHHRIVEIRYGEDVVWKKS